MAAQLVFPFWWVEKRRAKNQFIIIRYKSRLLFNVQNSQLTFDYKMSFGSSLTQRLCLINFPNWHFVVVSRTSSIFVKALLEDFLFFYRPPCPLENARLGLQPKDKKWHGTLWVISEQTDMPSLLQRPWHARGVRVLSYAHLHARTNGVKLYNEHLCIMWNGQYSRVQADVWALRCAVTERAAMFVHLNSDHSQHIKSMFASMTRRESRR